jgi:hypothetical protein
MAGDTTCASRTFVPRSRGRFSVISFGPPFPVSQDFSITDASWTNRNTSPGAIPKRNCNGISGRIRRPCLGPEFKSWDSGSYAQVGMKPNPRRRRSSASSANGMELGSCFNISDSLPMLHFRGRIRLGQAEKFEWGIFVSEWRYARAKGNPETAGQPLFSLALAICVGN